MKAHHDLLPIDRIRARRLLFYLVGITIKIRSIYIALLAVVVLGGLLLSLFDGKSVAEGQYLAVITALTVGYGDLAPVTWPARIVSGVVGIVGIVLTGVMIACILKSLELTFREDIEELARDSVEADSDHDPDAT